MFEEKGNKKGNWLTYSLVVAAGLGMVFIGVPIFSETSSQVPLSINGQKVGANYINQVYSQLQSQNPEESNEKLREAAINEIISQTLLQQHALQSGYALSDNALRQIVKANFYDEATYQDALKQMGLTARAYQESLRASQSSENYYRFINSAQWLPKARVDAFLSLFGQKRDVSTVTLPITAALEKISTDDEAALKAYYDSHLDQYIKPESADIAYFIFDSDHLVAADEISDEALQQEKDKLLADTARDGKYIIFDDPKAAQSAKADLDSGTTSFASLYQEVQEGKIKGEANLFDLHKKGEGVLPEVDDALFALSKTGDVSPIINTEYGDMIIMLGNIKQTTLPSDEELRAKLAKAKGMEAFIAKANSILDAAQAGESLDKLAERAKSSVLQVDNLSLDTTTLEWARSPDAQEQLFGKKAIALNVVSAPVNLKENKILFFTVKERMPAAQESFESVKSKVINDYRLAKAKELLDKEGEQIIIAWQKNESIEPLVQADQGESKQWTQIDRIQQSIEGLDDLTRSQLLEQDTLLQTLSDANGNMTVSRLDSVKAGDPAQTPEEVRLILSEQLKYLLNRDLSQNVNTLLRKNADIVIDSDSGQ